VDTDEGKDIAMGSFTEVTLCDYEGRELKKYQFRGSWEKMKVLKTSRSG